MTTANVRGLERGPEGLVWPAARDGTSAVLDSKARGRVPDDGPSEPRPEPGEELATSYQDGDSRQRSRQGQGGRAGEHRDRGAGRFVRPGLSLRGGRVRRANGTPKVGETGSYSERDRKPSKAAAQRNVMSRLTFLQDAVVLSRDSAGPPREQEARTVPLSGS